MNRFRRSSWRISAGLLAVVALAGLAPPAAVGLADGVATARNFELVGQNPLLGRGMNAAPAIYNEAGTGRTFVYVGSRTDSSNGHPNAGILVVDSTDVANPTVVSEIGGPAEGRIGETSRELRVWPEAKLLVVMHFTCSSLIHACDPVTDQVEGTAPNFTFYDLTNPVAPALALQHFPVDTPHEMFLWTDPVNAGRALLYMTTPASSTQAANLQVLDISGVAQTPRTQPVVLARWSANGDIDSGSRRQDDVRLHSIGVSPDGKRTFLAYLGGGFLVVDTSPLTNPALQPPVGLKLLTSPSDRPHWGSPGAHSAVKVLGTKMVDGVERKYALTTDEVYGESSTPLAAGKGRHGCPWGWVRTLDVTDETRPVVVGEYKIARNETEGCVAPGASSAPAPSPQTPLDHLDAVTEGLDPTAPLLASYSAHNPTVLKNLAFVTWHSGGLQAIDLSDPAQPAQAGEFVPTPLASVATEDPALSTGLSKVVMWSYPILNRQSGETFIYVVDLRNGLYVLRYTGPHAAEVNGVSFLEGNSSVGDAAALDGFVAPPVGEPAPGGLAFGAVGTTALHLDSSLPVGDAQRVAEFGAVDDGPRLVAATPTGPSKAQSFSRFGNPGLPANPLLAYFSYTDPVRIDGSPSLRLWLSAPAAPGVIEVPLGVELFVDGVPIYGSADATGAWIPFTVPVQVGPVPTLVTVPLPAASVTALDNVLVQFGLRGATAGPAPKAATVLYGSPVHDSVLEGPFAFPL